MTPSVCIGTSGWQYADWRDAFYPAGLPTTGWLDHYASVFSTVEVNNTFYRLPEAGTFDRWKRETPPGFVMAVKASLRGMTWYPTRPICSRRFWLSSGFSLPGTRAPVGSPVNSKPATLCTPSRR